MEELQVDEVRLVGVDLGGSGVEGSFWSWGSRYCSWCSSVR